MRIEEEVRIIERDNELLDKVADLAEAFTSITDIALILRLDPFDLRQKIKDNSSAISEAYRRGKATALLKVRRATVKKAESGDVPAVQEVRHFHSLMNDDEAL